MNNLICSECGCKCGCRTIDNNCNHPNVSIIEDRIFIKDRIIKELSESLLDQIALTKELLQIKSQWIKCTPETMPEFGIPIFILLKSPDPEGKSFGAIAVLIPSSNGNYWKTIIGQQFHLDWAISWMPINHPTPLEE